MRQVSHQKRGRGRGGNNNRRPNTPNRNQTFDSNGPDVRIRGNAHQVYEKYLTLARDASTAGDRVLAESLFQHADHYFRIHSVFNEENEARKNAYQQDTGQHPGTQQRNDEARKDVDEQAGSAIETRIVQTSVVPSPDEDSTPVRKTRSERRQDAEAAEQAELAAQPGQKERQQRHARRLQNSTNAPQEATASATENDTALRAMLGASKSGIPKAATSKEAPAAATEPEAKPVRRRGRPRKVVETLEPALPLADED
jgi:hypothetical protein